MLLDQVQDHVAAGAQAFAQLQDHRVARLLGFRARLRLGGLHPARAVLGALVLGHRRDRHEEAVRRQLHDVRPDLVGRHRRPPFLSYCFGTNPDAWSAPSPKKCLRICSSRYLRARGSARFSRFSFTSIFWCSSHAFHASLETLSQSFLPSSPGYGGTSRPSASFFSLMQLTMHAITTPSRTLSIDDRNCRARPSARGARTDPAPRSRA